MLNYRDNPQAFPHHFLYYFFPYLNHYPLYAACNIRIIAGKCKIGAQLTFMCIIKGRGSIEVHSILSFSIIPLSPFPFYFSFLSQLIIYLFVGQYIQILIFLIEPSCVLSINLSFSSFTLFFISVFPDTIPGHTFGPQMTCKQDVCI